jgi:murein DD-endopeptidase MepM/ murein hydrolase activator NlpD
MRLRLLLPVLLAFQAGAPPALAWTWPVDGPVLKPFAYEGDPYAAGQHRGVDLAAPRGSPVVAPAGGVVDFAGTVPGGGRTLTIATGDGYAVTLLHLGSSSVAVGTDVAEGAVVGSVGPSGEAEHPVPYVHLGIRLAADPAGYMDPLGLLPPPAGPPPVEEPVGGEEPVTPAAAPAAEAVDAPAPAPPTFVSAGATAVTEDVVESRPERVRKRSARGEKRQRANPGRDIRSLRAAPEHALDRVSPGSFDRPSPPGSQMRGHAVDAAATATRPRADREWTVPAALLLALSGLMVCRQLGHALLANRTPAMLLQLRGASTKDAHPLRTRKDDRVLSYGDLERILLGQAETLANLDRDDDAAELVDVPHDARRHARAATRASPRPPRVRRFHCVCFQTGPVIPRTALGVPSQTGSETRGEGRRGPARASV